jgi:uncharacterized protein
MHGDGAFDVGGVMIDRLSIRTRPPGRPVMYQSWGKLLFMHWPVAEELLRPLIATRLSIDTFEGHAWVGVTPFTMWGIRPAFLPPLPVLSTSHELNVRTYVHLDGVPGVWFLSLDASNALAVWGARSAYFLPYFRARMQLQEHNSLSHFTSTRTHPGAPAARFDATWAGGDPLPAAAPGSLDFFLIERYCLYSARRGQLYRARIFHRPWPLRRVELRSFASTMLESHGLPTPPQSPLLHAQAEPLGVAVWRLERV